MRALPVLFMVALSGCASLEPPADARLASPSPPVRACAEWFRALDGEVDAAGVRDAQYTPVQGFPYLRVDRFFASLRGRAAENESALHAFAERLLELDLEARQQEIENLPRASAERLPGMSAEFSRRAALRRTAECARLLRELDLAAPAQRSALLARASVPDDYSIVLRALGLYPLTRIVFAQGVRRWEDSTRAAFHGESRGGSRGQSPAPAGVSVRFGPPALATASRDTVAGMLARAEFDPLGQPLFSDRELDLLAATYAPSFEIAVSDDYDRFGELRWRRGRAVPEVEAAEPAVYVRRAYARYGERVLLQLVYTLWFPERPAEGAFDLLAGRLDGIVWRVTLGPDGEPLVYDSIHPCGCYHQFFPTPRATPRPAPDALEEWAFVPQQLPRLADGERPVVRIASGTHYIEAVGVTRGPDSLARYAFRPYDELRSLPSMEGRQRSAFGPQGLIAGTERLERFLFWPMGIASAGAMRQWGRHATAFVGRRHFDDADLIERRFELHLAEAH